MSNYVKFGEIPTSNGSIHVGVLAPEGQVRIEITRNLRGAMSWTPDDALTFAATVTRAALAAPSIHAAYMQYRDTADKAAKEYGDMVKGLEAQR
ncbi:hypothetical protein [Mycobacteroides abscessus]|uniref:hypothetical protein n=1 Tax=Mycobacteroides abscessus TaxID=36809 RepID=UPI001896A184